MKKKNILSKNRDFQRIIESKKQFISSTLVLYYEKKKDPITKIGISVSKKLGGAVLRNKIKRVTRNILHSYLKKEMNYNLVIIVRKKFIDLPYDQKTKEVIYILKKIKAIKKEGE